MIRILILAVLCAATPLCAATLTVTNLNDSGAGSLRQACTDAVSGDDIVFDAALAGTLQFNTEIDLGTKDLTITGNVNGGGAPSIVLDGRSVNRLFVTSAPLTLNLLDIFQGSALYTDGGAILIGDGTLTCVGCIFRGSVARRGGAIATASGATSTVICTDCTFNANSATDGTQSAEGGAIWASTVTCTNCRFLNHYTFAGNNHAYGGAIFAGSVSCVGCTFSDNECWANSGQNAHGGAIRAASNVSCTDCTFEGNSATGGSAFSTARGGAVHSDGPVTCSGCTFDSNSSHCPIPPPPPSPIVFGGAISGLAVTCSDSTFAGNTVNAGVGAGSCIAATASLLVTNCILSGSGNMFSGSSLTSGGYNICTAAAGSVPWLNATGDQPGTDPLLGPLQDNGGPVHTMLPAPNSPAIDQGGGTITNTDARGVARPFDNAGIANATDGRDVGAAEFVFGLAPVITAPATLGVAPDTTHTFSGTISIADADAGTDLLEVALAVTNGTLTLPTITGLTFTTGDGTADAAMTFTATLTDINAALNGMSFTPTTSYIGAAILQIDVDDQGNTGDGALTDTHTVNITVDDLPEITLLRGTTEITSGGGDNAYSTGEPVVRTYTIQNDGVTPLTIGTISFSNESNCTVALTTAPSAVIAPGGTSDFTITITPGTSGFFSFDFTIDSNDADENPYNVHVVGTAVTGGKGEDNDNGETCSTGVHTGLAWLALLGVIVALGWRARGRQA